LEQFAWIFVYIQCKIKIIDEKDFILNEGMRKSHSYPKNDSATLYDLKDEHPLYFIENRVPK